MTASGKGANGQQCTHLDLQEGSERQALRRPSHEKPCAGLPTHVREACELNSRCWNAPLPPFPGLPLRRVRL